MRNKLVLLFSGYSRRKKYSLLMELLRNEPSSILDIGCGKGGFLERYLLNHENSYLLEKVIALDLRERYLKELRKKFKVGQTIIGDACNLPFPDKSIDLVCCNALLEHLPLERREKFSKEVQRIAKSYWIATPSRFSFIEVHYYLPFIGWFKPNLRNQILKFLRIKLHNDPINLLTFKKLKDLFLNATEFRKMRVAGLFEHLVAIKNQKKKLTIILPTEAKLEESKEIGLLSRWKFYFAEYSKCFDIEVYSCDGKSFSKELKVKHCPIPFSLGFIPYGNQILYNFYLLIRAPFMSEILKIVSVSYFILPLIKAFKKKIILSHKYSYGTKTKMDFGGIKRLTSSMREYLSIKSADVVIVTTDELQKKVKEIYKKDSIIIPNFVDESKFFPSEKKKYILYAGRIYWHKGIDYLIEAFSKIEKGYPDYKLKLAGIGDLENYKKKVHKSGIRNIEFLETVDNSKMPDLMGRAKIFVLPTVTCEGHPKALIEAMASGCACIATDVPGNRDLIRNEENGLLVKSKDGRSLIGAITKILSDEDLRIKLGENARKTAEKFSIENTLQKEMELLKRLIKESKDV